MYDFLRELLSDKTGGVVFQCFGLFHLCYIAVFVTIAVLLCLYLKNKRPEHREKTANIVIGIAFGVYIADFFLMPFFLQNGKYFLSFMYHNVRNVLLESAQSFFGQISASVCNVWFLIKPHLSDVSCSHDVDGTSSNVLSCGSDTCFSRCNDDLRSHRTDI